MKMLKRSEGCLNNQVIRSGCPHVYWVYGKFLEPVRMFQPGTWHRSLECVRRGLLILELMSASFKCSTRKANTVYAGTTG